MLGKISTGRWLLAGTLGLACHKPSFKFICTIKMFPSFVFCCFLKKKLYWMNFGTKWFLSRIFMHFLVWNSNRTLIYLDHNKLRLPWAAARRWLRAMTIMTASPSSGVGRLVRRLFSWTIAALCGGLLYKALQKWAEYRKRIEDDSHELVVEHSYLRKDTFVMWKFGEYCSLYQMSFGKGAFKEQLNWSVWRIVNIPSGELT